MNCRACQFLPQAAGTGVHELLSSVPGAQQAGAATTILDNNKGRTPLSQPQVPSPSHRTHPSGATTRGTPDHAGTHREGGLGDLRAVVGDAPAEAARETPAVRLLLAAHHGLHGVAAHTDGPLWGRQGVGA